MAFIITEATREKLKLRLAVTGTAGSGKTYTAMLLAKRIAEAEHTNYCIIDTEHGRARLYGAQFAANGKRPGHIDFSAPFSPERYVEAIRAVEQSGQFGLIVIDSLSHEWMGDGGALALVDELGAAGRHGKFVSGWGAVTPMHNRLLEAILQSPLHVIATLRSKTGYAMDQQSKVVSKLGMEVVQRDGVDFEFDVVFDMETPNAKATVSKSRCQSIPVGKVIVKPQADVADTLLTWLDEGIDTTHELPTVLQQPTSPAQQQPRRSSGPAPADRAMTEAAGVQTRSEAQMDTARFWTRAKEAGFETKSAVHIALGLAVRDGALAEWAALDGNSYEKALTALKLGIPVVKEHGAEQPTLLPVSANHA